MKHTIKLTEEQCEWLLKRMKIDFDEEINFQASDTGVNTEYLEMELSIYKELLYATDTYAYQRTISNTIIEEMNEEIHQLNRREL